MPPPLALGRLWIYIAIPVLVLLLSKPYPSLDDDVPINEIQLFGGARNPSTPLRILLLTAHPDDECMFFAPTVTSLTNTGGKDGGGVDSEEKYELYSLCLSNGDQDGLGQVREGELAHALDILGVKPDRRVLLEEPFHDNINEFWNATLVAEHLQKHVLAFDIDVILTFDVHGVSSHPNHISLMNGAAHLISHQTQLSSHSNLPIPPESLRLFTLRTVNTLTKYTGSLGGISRKTFVYLCLAKEQYLGILCEPGEHLYVSSWNEYMKAVNAMLKHQSQMVWFRWFYIAFSRYMWVNEWVEIFPSVA